MAQWSACGMEELARRLSEATSFDGNKGLVWKGLQSAVDVIGKCDAHIFGFSNGGYTLESVRYSIIECHISMDRPYCEVVTRNMGRMLLTDNLCASFTRSVADAIGFTEDDLLDFLFGWKAFLMIALVVALAEGWGSDQDCHEYADNLVGLYQNDGDVYRIDVRRLASTCLKE